MCGGGHVWLGGVHGRGACIAGEACMAGSMHGRGDAWQGSVWWGACVAGDMCGRGCMGGGDCRREGACMVGGMHGWGCVCGRGHAW